MNGVIRALLKVAKKLKGVHLAELALVAVFFVAILLVDKKTVLADGETMAVLSLGGANTQYSLTIPKDQYYRFKSRDNAIRYAYVTGKVAGSTDPYTATAANVWISGQRPTKKSTVIYFATGSASAVVEYEYQRR